MDLEREVERLESRVSSLELELEQYHEWLEEAIDQRDRLALNAAWGIVKVSCGVLAYLGTYYTIFQWLELKGWIWGGVAAVLGMVAYLVVYAWQDRGEDKDVEKLHRLPKWIDRKKSR